MRHIITTMLISGALLVFGSSTCLSAEDDGSEAGYTATDLEYYLDKEQLAFVRPGLELEIIDVTIPDDLQPEVTFKLTDPQGLPLDREGVFTPGPVSTSFVFGFIPEGETAYVAYTTRVQTSPITGDSAVQASTDSGGAYTDLSDGMYTYKFSTVLPSDYDMSATHTMAIYARRDLTDFELDRYVVNELEHFIPSGEGTPMPRDMVTTETCNRCHDPLAIHGGSRQEVGLCVMCHNPTQSIDPDTGDSVNMPYMVHKIHAGAGLEFGYTIIGFRQGVHDYSEVIFPADLNDCQTCHTGGVPTADDPMVLSPNPAPSCDANGVASPEVMWGDEGRIQIRLNSADGKLFASTSGAGTASTGKWVRNGMEFVMVAEDGTVLDNDTANTTVLGCASNPPGVMMGAAADDHTIWKNKLSRVACGSCHDGVDFENGSNHPKQSSDDSCHFCHQSDTGMEFDLSVVGAHTVEYKSSQLDGILVEIMDVTNADPGRSPIVTFQISDRNGRINPNDLGRLRFSLNGPNEDYDFYVQENVKGKARLVGKYWTYQFMADLPSDAMGSYTLGVEGRNDVELEAGRGDNIETEDQIQNFTSAFAVTDTMPVDRRMVVDDAKCESCHSNLSLHGGNRHDASGYCQTCHMPNATDEAVRPEGTGEPQSIDFRYMIHKIHRGADLENGYVVYGFRSSLHDFSHVEFVGDLRNCEACHVDGSNLLPLNDGLLPVTTPRDAFTPMLPETASCLSCHDDSSSVAHASANSSELGEACAVCHGAGKTWAVEKVHAR